MRLKLLPHPVAVGIGREYPPAVIAEGSLWSAIAPLRNVMRIPRDGGTYDWSHDSSLHFHTSRLKKLVMLSAVFRLSLARNERSLAA